MNQVRLSPSDLDIIRDIVLRRAPDLVPVVDRLAQSPTPSLVLSDIEVLELASPLVDEFVERGLGEDYEPNEYGKQLDNIIGIIYLRK
ncbi:MAG: hypothetical protein K6U12_12785 [Armatimonadetes bacterium]|nr:hypothetical protein [Armatimonadota bacterium]